jgi:chromosome segregation ATPase
MDMQAAVNTTQNRIGVLDQEKAAITEDQNRIRQNIGSVSRDTELYKRYTTKLNEQETRLEAIRDERQKLQDTLTRQQQELDAYVRSLNVE